jgi:hypothetical protein
MKYQRWCQDSFKLQHVNGVTFADEGTCPGTLEGHIAQRCSGEHDPVPVHLSRNQVRVYVDFPCARGLLAVRHKGPWLRCLYGSHRRRGNVNVNVEPAPS